MPSLDVNGERLAYLEQGAGRPVVLLHGIGADAGLWAETVSALGGGYRTYALNLRGYGGSSCNGDLSVAAMAGDVLAAADALGLAGFDLVGVSLGGAVAIHVAGRAPQRVRSLVVSGVGAGPGKALGDEIYGIREAAHYLAPEDFGPQVGEALLVPDAPAQRIEALASAIGVLTKQRYLRSLEALAAADLGAVAGTVAAPTLVLRGALDELADAVEAKKLAALVPGARYAEIEDAGHLANIDNPVAFAAALKDAAGR